MNKFSIGYIAMLIFSVICHSEQSANNLWSQCQEAKSAECNAKLNLAQNATHTSCVNFINSQCKLEVFNYCVAQNGRPEGCASFGVTLNQANFSVNVDAGRETSQTCPDGQYLMRGRCTGAAGENPSSIVVAKPSTALAGSTKPTNQLPTKASQQPGATQPKESAIAESEATSDVSTCRSLLSQAGSSCRAPEGSVGPAQGQSLADYCSQMKALGSAGANANGNLAAACYTSFRTCSNTCDDLASKYDQLEANCDNCDSADIYSQTAQTLHGMKSSCDRYASQAQGLGQSALASGQSGAGSDLCSQVSASMNPQSLTQGAGAVSPGAVNVPAGAGDPYGCGSNPGSAACVQCSRAPNLPACQALARASEARRGLSGFMNPKSRANGSGGGFNLSADLTGGQADGSVSKGSSGPEVQVNTVPNGGGAGGAVPSSDSSVSMAAQLNTRSRPSPGSPGFDTDKQEQGFRSSGYSQQSGSANESGSSNSAAGNQSANGARNPASLVGMDLKKWLPGGEKYRGGNGTRSPEIYGPGVDLWQKITDRMQEKCRLGELYDCR